MWYRILYRTILSLAIILAPFAQVSTLQTRVVHSAPAVPAADDVLPASGVRPAPAVLAPSGTTSLTYRVTSSLDTVDAAPGDWACKDASGQCTLRAAIMEANAHPGYDHIELHGEDIQLSLGQLDITDRVVIGSVEDKATIRCPYGERCLQISNDTALYNLLIQGGSIFASTPSGAPDQISLHMDDCDLVYGSIETIQINLYITGGKYQNGSGISVYESTLVLQNATVVNNRGNAGAGIHGWGSNVSIYNSTISGNTAPRNQWGGGVNVDISQLTIVNSTISGNRAGSDGGGLIVDGSTATIINSTITQNQAGAGSGGGLMAIAGGTVHLSGTIIAGNGAVTEPDCDTKYQGSIISNGYNLIGNTTGCPITAAAGDLFNKDAGLAPILEDLGGPTLTHRLEPGSPAIDAGNPAGCADIDGSLLTYDQRLFPRAQDGNGDGTAACDIGAVEALPAGSPGLWECQDAATPNACHDLMVADMVSPDSGWALGRGGTMLRWNGKVWVPDTRSNKDYEWYDIDNIDPNAAWAVGLKMGTGQAAVASWDGSQWVESTIDQTSRLGAVSAISSGDVWAINQNTILHNTGSGWAEVPNPAGASAYLIDIKMVSANLGWIVGLAAAPGGPALLLRWDGSQWNTIETPFIGSLNSIDALSANDMWAVGQTAANQAGLLHWDGQSWAVTTWPLPNGTPSASLASVDMVGPGDVWAVGFENVPLYATNTYLPLLLHWNGATWAPIETPAAKNIVNNWIDITSLTMSAANDGWIFGQNGLIWRWNGRTWLPASAGFRGDDYSAIERLSPEKGWTASSNKATLWEGWINSFSLPDAAYLNDFDFYADDAGWIVDGGGLIYEIKNDRIASTVDMIHWLGAVSAVSASDAWAAGDGFYHWDGTQWMEKFNPGDSIQAIDMISATDGWAAGTNLWRWNGSSWNQVASPLTYRITGLDMLSATDGWAVGQENQTQSALLHWNGSGWSKYASVDIYNLKKISMVSANEGWAISLPPSKGGGPGMDIGRIYHWDGQSWTEYPRPVGGFLEALSMDPSGSGQIVGGNGLILNFQHTSSPQTFRVTKTANTLDGTCNNDCSLREAAAAANTHPGFDTIVVPVGTYNLANGGAPGTLEITDSVEINAAGSGATLIESGNVVVNGYHPGTAAVIDVILNGMTIRHAGINSGFANLTLRSVVVRDNAGPGVWAADGSVTLQDCLITNNTYPNYVGGVRANLAYLTIERSTISDNTGGWGGISSDIGADIISSTISGNTGTHGPGGIRAVGGLSLINSTVSGNHGSAGAGIWTNQGAEIFISTITDNHAVGTGSEWFTNGQGGGLYFYGDGEVLLQNSILAGNTSSAGSPDCFGTMTTWSRNLFGSTAGCNIVSDDGDNLLNIANPGLGPLADNGGPTRTHALLHGSPAIDAAWTNSCHFVDQRGEPRPAGEECDIGAYELQTPYAVNIPFIQR